MMGSQQATRIAVRDSSIDSLVKQEKFIAVGNPNPELYIYDSQEGIWVRDAEAFVRNFVNLYFESNGLKACESDRNEVIKWLSAQYWIPRDKWHPSPRHLCFKNGVFQLIDMTGFEPETGIELGVQTNFDSDYQFMNKLDIIWDMTAKCPLIDKFLHEVLKSEEDVQAFYELAGYCLWQGRMFIQRAFMFLGTGANGKSTCASLLRRFLGIKNISSVSLHSLCNNRFAPAELYEKLANIDPDLTGNEALKKTSIFKAITGDDMLFAERKFHHPFFFMNKAVPIFLANKFPWTPDDSDAFYRRWLYFDFPHQFLGDKADKDLLDVLTSPEELSGFAIQAVLGLYRLLKRKEFTNDILTVQEKRDKWNRNSDPVRAFCTDILEETTNWEIPKEEVYNAYWKYCEKNHFVPKSDNSFFRRLKRMIRYGEPRPRKGEKRIYCLSGIKLKDNDNVGKSTSQSMLPQQQKFGEEQ